jgi:hypothetical protein
MRAQWRWLSSRLKTRFGCTHIGVGSFWANGEKIIGIQDIRLFAILNNILILHDETEIAFQNSIYLYYGISIYFFCRLLIH